MRYRDFTAQKQAAYNDFLDKYAFFAFNEKQFAEGMKKLDLDPETDKGALCNLGGGGFLLKEHARGFAELADRTAKERQALIDDPETGAAFARDMFLTELEDHEYSWTGDAADALTALGYTWDRVQADPVLKRAFEEAEKIAAQRE